MLALRKSLLLTAAFFLLSGGGGVLRAEEPPAAAAPATTPSPWLALPTVQSNPKLGTSVGALGAYLKKFDAQSQLSMFGIAAQYTSTNSMVGTVFARTSFGADHHRISVIAIGGTIKNDYDDFLGTGQPLKSEDHIRGLIARYLYRIKDDWFLGAQLVATNYQIVGQTALDDDILGLLGLTGFKAGGIGLVAMHDSRDVQDSPTRGWLLNLNNIAYRQRIQGDADFDVYRGDFRGFWTHGDRHVLAVRQSNQWTVDAPPSAFAPVQLRGYTVGEFLGKNMSSLEVEERHRIAERWTATLFAGVACLYGAGKSCSQSENRFPSIGAGVQYLLKPAQGIVANLEFAQGKEGNRAVLFKMGYAW
ncbi:hypothetical protein JJ685_17990 [Ramlibacter monticola]|uniref:Bacterial surface antigen (D15) domain-containing protein n=1 Tax=Ramlibacter monticola TaxID=1926872 RepID=A0A936Z158_9BURK|nr:hypothetical protein [Ramlibacter monticola]MBL0393035.1 hypothetical protein [Ramlibacter monticola]